MNEQPLVEILANGNISASHRYKLMFVGESSWGALVRYELLTGLLGPLPGALGYVLRGKCYRWLFQRMGPGSVIGRSVTLRCPGRITLGTGVMIDDYVVLDAKGVTSQVTLGDQVLVGRNSILSCNEASIQIGDFVSIGPFCHFAAKGRLAIGSNVSIGSGAQLLAGSHESSDPNTPVIRQKRVAEGITVESDVWIGTAATILDGVTVGRGSIVGASSVVNKDVPAGAVVLGNPARVIQNRQKASTHENGR